MFTGIVERVGRIVRTAPQGDGLRIVIDTGAPPFDDVGLGDSIAVSGCCLTVTALADGAFAADVSRESLSLTTLGELAVGARVNLEPALRAGDALGGHLVSGHVDGIAQVTAISGDARSTRVSFRVPAALSRYVARKGSVTIDGVSLTVNEVERDVFGVNLIPHTQSVTTLGELKIGSKVNFEVDTIARYVERLVGERQ